MIVTFSIITLILNLGPLSPAFFQLASHSTPVCRPTALQLPGAPVVSTHGGHLLNTMSASQLSPASVGHPGTPTTPIAGVHPAVSPHVHPLAASPSPHPHLNPNAHLSPAALRASPHPGAGPHAPAGPVTSTAPPHLAHGRSAVHLATASAHPASVGMPAGPPSAVAVSGGPMHPQHAQQSAQQVAAAQAAAGMAPPILYYGVDMPESVPNDLPFLGCVLHFAGYEDYKDKEKETWTDAVRRFGAIVEKQYSPRVTHVVTDSQHTEAFKQVKLFADYRSKQNNFTQIFTAFSNVVFNVIY